MKRFLYFVSVVVLLFSCEKPYYDDLPDDSDAGMRFVLPADAVVKKMNIQLFDHTGAKVFEKVKTQLSGDSDFGRLSPDLDEGAYTVVAVAHSSVVSASIRSPQAVHFTASAGEKLTDTFSYCGEIACDGSAVAQDCGMQRVTAMVRFIFTDDMPENVARIKFDYTGGSANYNPTTLQGITKSTQSESRTLSDSGIYEIYTFPYLSESGVLKITVTPLASDGSAIREPRIITDVPVTRNRITTLTGALFGGSEFGKDTNGFTFTVEDWGVEDVFEF